MTTETRIRGYSLACLLLTSLLAGSCSEDMIYTDLRIYSSPYGSIDWNAVQRLKAQHHDHIPVGSDRILSYDDEGYDVLSLMDYSGNASLDHAMRQRMWPPRQWVPAWMLSSLTNLKFFIPNAEEVGHLQHGTSPFLMTYIEGVSSTPGSRQAWQYTSVPEMFEVIRANGGFPCLAHPWTFPYETLHGAFCVEIYTAFGEARKLDGWSEFTTTDQSAVLVANWDRALHNNQQVYGIAVNDHYGPYATSSTSDEIRDSGKIIVLTDSATPESYKNAFESGAFFAIRDFGAVKDEYPHIFSISTDEEAAFIETLGDVRWISGGTTIGSNAVLLRTDLPANSRYVRAEIRPADGTSVVFTQAFAVRPVGDVDGDYDIDQRDSQICENVAAGIDTLAARISACIALADP